MTLAENHTSIIDYEGSDYQQTFWDFGDRKYEDAVEAIALKRLLPASGKLLLELGAGAGRNTQRYSGFEKIVLLDYSQSQLRLAQERLGKLDRYIYVLADVCRLPFVPGLFDAATMIRIIHHLPKPLTALEAIQEVITPGGAFILEFSNKRNVKAVLRYLFKRQTWSPFELEPVEFAHLNYDFHPKLMKTWLVSNGFSIERSLTVSHFRLSFLKRTIPLRWLISLDALLQYTGRWWELTPSVFLRSKVVGHNVKAKTNQFFRCPVCHQTQLDSSSESISCTTCSSRWAVKDGIYDFREPE